MVSRSPLTTKLCDVKLQPSQVAAVTRCPEPAPAQLGGEELCVTTPVLLALTAPTVPAPACVKTRQGLPARST